MRLSATGVFAPGGLPPRGAASGVSILAVDQIK